MPTYGFSPPTDGRRRSYRFTTLTIVRIFAGREDEWLPFATIAVPLYPVINAEQAAAAYRDYHTRLSRDPIGDQVTKGRSRVVLKRLHFMVKLGFLEREGQGTTSKYRLSCWFCQLCGHLASKSRPNKGTLLCNECKEHADAHHHRDKRKKNQANGSRAKATRKRGSFGKLDQ